MHRWLLARMFKCFDDWMLTCVDIHMFDIHTWVHKQWSWNVYSLGGISHRVVGRICFQLLWWLCLYAEEIGEIRGMCTWVLKCSSACMISQWHSCLLSWSNAWMFSCFVDSMLTFELALMITCSHFYMLWWSHAPMFRCFDVQILLWLHVLMIIYSHAYVL